MTPAELAVLLHELIAGWENEVVEFKEANDNFSTSDIGKYFSALSNEANLSGADAGWLVFGVNNSTRSPRLNVLLNPIPRKPIVCSARLLE